MAIDMCCIECRKKLVAYEHMVFCCNTCANTGESDFRLCKQCTMLHIHMHELQGDFRGYCISMFSSRGESADDERTI